MASLSKPSLISLFWLLGCTQPVPENGRTAEKAPAAPKVVAAPDAEPSDPSSVVATWNGGSITAGELDALLGGKLVKLEVDYKTERHGTQQQGLEQLIAERLLEDEAKRRGMADTDALLDAEIEKAVPPPSDKEIEAFYKVMKRRLGNRPLDEVKDRVAEELDRRAKAERFREFIQGLRDDAKVETHLPYPEMPRIDVGNFDDDPSIGPDDAPVTIVQFAEFQCPYCGKAKETVDAVMEQYKGKVRMVSRDFPLSFHDRAIPAAVAANCADKQGKYWDMYDLMMANQRALEDADLLKHAQEVGLDIEAWKTCQTDPAMTEEVLADQADGAKAGVAATPTFFINGILLSGALPLPEFQSVVDKELNKG